MRRATFLLVYGAVDSLAAIAQRDGIGVADDDVEWRRAGNGFHRIGIDEFR
jgi:hypothetical protein